MLYDAGEELMGREMNESGGRGRVEAVSLSPLPTFWFLTNVLLPTFKSSSQPFLDLFKVVFSN